MVRNLRYAKYPTLGEVLRFVSQALDLRARSEKKICDRLDRAAREGEFNSEVIDELIQGLIVAPLSRLGEDRLGRGLAHFLAYGLHEYAKLMVKLPVDAMTRDDLMPVLTSRFFADLAAQFMRHMANDKILPDPHLLLAPSLFQEGEPEGFLRTTIELHLSGSLDSARSAAQLNHCERSDSDHTRRDKVRRWLNRKQLPDLDGLLLLPSLANGSSKSLKDGGLRDRALLRQLIVARALDFAFSKAASRARLCAEVRRFLDPDTPPTDIGMELSSANSRHAARFSRDLIEQGLQLHHDLGFDQNRSHEEIERAAAVLENFSVLAEQANAPWATDWMLNWCYARLAFWRGDWANALGIYEDALRCAFYNAGHAVKQLTIEALFIACRMGKRTVIKRLMNPVRALNIQIPLLDQDIGLALTQPKEVASLLRLRHLGGIPANFGPRPYDLQEA